MAQVFAVLQARARNGKRGSPSMLSKAMQQGLRLYGVFIVTALACNACVECTSHTHVLPVYA